VANRAIPGLPERIERAVAEADRLTSELRREGGSARDVTSSPEYQELDRLMVILQVETSRTLSETAQLASELEEADLAEKLSCMEVVQ
jgi:hypothetical protein